MLLRGAITFRGAPSRRRRPTAWPSIWNAVDSFARFASDGIHVCIASSREVREITLD